MKAGAENHHQVCPPAGSSLPQTRRRNVIAIDTPSLMIVCLAPASTVLHLLGAPFVCLFVSPAADRDNNRQSVESSQVGRHQVSQRMQIQTGQSREETSYRCRSQPPEISPNLGCS